MNLGQPSWAIPNIKRYIFNPVPSKLILLESVVVTIAIDHQMVVIQLKVGKNFIEDVLLDGGSRINIITEKLKIWLNLSNQNLHLITYIWLIKPLQNLYNTRNIGFGNCRLQLKFSCMRHMQLQICVVA